MKKTVLNLIKKYLFFSFRRRKIDEDLKKNIRYFKGKVLDIGGGRKRGNFSIPKNLKKNWLIVDIDKKKKPDIVARVENLPFKRNSFKTIKATELFEHVKNPTKGIKECLRVLKKKGHFIVSIPFLYPLHADPSDYQRFTEYKLRELFERLENNRIVLFKKQGFMFTVIADMLKGWILTWPMLLRYFAYIFIFPFLELIVSSENLKFFNKNKYLTRYISGYFLIIQKT